MNNPTTFNIALTEAVLAIEDMKGSIEKLLRKAMSITKGHWVCTDEDDQFGAAVGAVMLHFGEDSEEFARLKWEMGNISRFSAALSTAQLGVQVDMSTVLKTHEKFTAIGLAKLWTEVK
jgi:hypothetical protein